MATSSLKNFVVLVAVAFSVACSARTAKIELTPSQKTAMRTRITQLQVELHDLGVRDWNLAQRYIAEPDPELLPQRVEIQLRYNALEKEQNDLTRDLYQAASSRDERRILDKMQKFKNATDKMERDQNQAARDTGLKCTPGFEGKTIVNPDAKAPDVSVAGGEKIIFITIRHPQSATDTFTLLAGDGKWLVKGMCPGGRLTVSVSLGWLFRGSKEVFLTAELDNGDEISVFKDMLTPSYLGDYYEVNKRGVNWTPFPDQTSSGFPSNTGGRSNQGGYGGWHVGAFMRGDFSGR